MIKKVNKIVFYGDKTQIGVIDMYTIQGEKSTYNVYDTVDDQSIINVKMESRRIGQPL